MPQYHHHPCHQQFGAMPFQQQGPPSAQPYNVTLYVPNNAPFPYYHPITLQELPWPEDASDDNYGHNTKPQAYTSDRPTAVTTNNPAVATLVLFKELSGYPNYGNPSGNADILYTGNVGEWSFELPLFFLVPSTFSARLVIRAVLDDHYNVSPDRYSARITLNGTTIHTGRLPLEHGSPAGGRFNNWRNLSFNVSNIRRSNRIVIANTSNAGPDDWIGLDWMELRLAPS